MSVYLKIHQHLYQKVIAVCDIDVVGKTFSNSKLTLTVNETFYKGDLVDLDSAIRILKDSDNFNIAGKIIVEACLAQGLISEHAIVLISELPVAMKFII